jgi:hypothetical protein
VEGTGFCCLVEWRDFEGNLSVVGGLGCLIVLGFEEWEVLLMQIGRSLRWKAGLFSACEAV